MQKHLVLTSSEFDFPSNKLPERVVYVGPELGDPDWVEPWESPWREDDRRPLVLVGFSTTFQNQADALARVIQAIAGLGVRAVVTAGPSLKLSDLPSAENVQLCVSAPHALLMGEAAAVVTHCGHGTVIRSLAAGVPMVCMPMGRDQNDNAARVTARGAGVRLAVSAPVDAIREAVRKVVQEPRYREAARELGRRIQADVKPNAAIEVLESVVGAVKK